MDQTPSDRVPMAPWKYFAPNKVNCKPKTPLQRKKKGRRDSSGCGDTHVGADYTSDEQEWLRHVRAFLSKHKRYPTLQEAFALALALGYRKVEDSNENGG